MTAATDPRDAVEVQVLTAEDPRNHRLNNLDGLRLVGALMVILGHAYALRAPFGTARIPKVLGYDVQTTGVVIFFCISGYLITASWNRSRNPWRYLLARALRIMPALVVVVLVTALVIGPIVSTLPRSEYFAHPFTRSYITNNLQLLPQFELPGVFVDLPYPTAVNGSLWTLGPEVACYLAVPLLLLVPGRNGALRALRMVLLVAALAWTIHELMRPPVESPIIHGTRLVDAAKLFVFFAAGAILRLLHERRFGLFRADAAVVVLGAYLLVLGVYPQYVDRYAWLFLPYVVLTIGLSSTPYVRRTARFGDLSYGLYIWAFPVQQLVHHTIGVVNIAVNLVLVTLITGVLALASWHLVEAPSLALKDRILRGRRDARPRRRVAV